MYGLKAMRTFIVGIFVILAITAVAIVTISGSAQRQNLTSNQTTIMSDGNTTSTAENLTKTKPVISNIKNVSIVTDAAGLEDKAYQPNPVKIKVGETVIWTNNDLTTHTVTEGNPSTNVPTNGFDSGLLNPDEIFKHVFDKAGTIEYHCILHPTMLGKVIVG